MITSIVSVLTGIPVRREVAMTGEMTLRGRVLPIGGLKEKLLAALRAGVTTVLIPEENEKDLAEIPDNVKKGLKIIPVATADAVPAEALSRPLTPIGSSRRRPHRWASRRAKASSRTKELAPRDLHDPAGSVPRPGACYSTLISAGICFRILGITRCGWELTGIEAAAYTFPLDWPERLAFRAHRFSSSPLAKGGCK
jgi:hypothetical protein